MLSASDILLLQKKGISPEKIEEQLHAFATGFPFQEIISAAEPGNGITPRCRTIASCGR